MVSSVNNNLIPDYLSKPFVSEKQSLEDERQERLTKSANAGASRILGNPAMIEVLNGPLAQYTEVSMIQVRRIVWSTLNYRDTGKITKDDLEFAVTSLGGDTIESANLWTKLDPEDTGELDYEAFLDSDFMNNYLRDNVGQIEQAIEDLRIQNIINGTTAGGNTNVLDGAGQQRSTGTIFDAEF